MGTLQVLCLSPRDERHEQKKKDESLKVIHYNFDQKDILIGMKMLGITVSALLIIGLMVTAVGKIGYEI